MVGFSRRDDLAHHSNSTQHSTAQHSTAQHSKAQGRGMKVGLAGEVVKEQGGGAVRVIFLRGVDWV